MAKSILAIFAHPDDESFGPGGTLALLAQKHDVHLLFVSKGESGEVEGCTEPHEKAIIRQKEAKEAAHILGIKSIHFLNFHDGLLCNNHYHQMAEHIKKRVALLKPDTLITFEARGFTGHLDHVLVSHVTTFVFQHTNYIKKVMYFCLDEKQRKAVPEYYIYFPPGYKKREIGESVDVSSVWEQKLQAIHAHKSQSHDIDFYEPILEASEKTEYFLIHDREDEEST